MAGFELKALITAKDRLSPQLTRLQKKIHTFRKNLTQASRGALGITAGLTAGATVALRAFARQEDAATGLKVAMMQAQGQVGAHFDKMNQLALTLGDTLPGTTADFQQMMQMLVRQGISAERILNGVGQASAYLAVQLNKTPEAAAEFAAKLQDATGTTAKDLMGLFDTIQRAFYLGVDDTNLLSFFTKTSSVLKMVHQDGLKAAQGLAPISVMMDQMGMKGESAGNAVRKMIQSGLDLKKVRRMNHKLQRLRIKLDFTDGRGGFGGLDTLFTQLDKLKQLTDVQRSVVIKGIFGEDAETGQVVNALLDKGRSGYDEIVQKMRVQASLNQRVTAQLGTLKNLWEAMTGTATNGLASIGAVFSGDITPLIEGLGDLSARFNTWVQTHPHVIRSLVGMVAGFTAVKLAILGVNLALKLTAAALAMSPIGRLLTGIGLAAGIIIANWRPVRGFFASLWQNLAQWASGSFETIKNLWAAFHPLAWLKERCDPMVDYLNSLWDKIRPCLEPLLSGLDRIQAWTGQGWDWITGPSTPPLPPVSAPWLSTSPLIQPSFQRDAPGELTVSFHNAPPGMTVQPAGTPPSWLSYDVGYNRFARR